MSRFNVANKKLGKRAKLIDHRTLELANYVKTMPPLPPRKADYLSDVDSWPMYLNDTIGDCAIAAPGHMIQEWTAASTSHVVTVTDDDILAAYEDVGGYVPGDPSTDNGCFLLDVLNYWKKTGIGGHKIAAFVSVDISNRIEVKQAIDLFGDIMLGIALPITAQDPVERGGQPCWEVSDIGATGDGSPGSWGGHCVPIGEYSMKPGEFHGVHVITWGMIYKMTWEFFDIYSDEAYAVLSQDWINAAGKSPTGFDLKTLLKDLSEIGK